ncbi:alpha/beta-hydrolase [Annulohypoxylon moriforme]|nr:alpha/beta-hydrolase [Annulohypoxylon moriforme]
MAPTKLTVVLVHGAWHVPASYDKLVVALQSAGYEVYVPHLTSMNGTRPPDGDLVTDTALVRSCVVNLVEAGQIVIILLHSYGGQVGTNALHGLSYQARMSQGLSGGVSHLIYMCAFILPEGWSTLNQAQSRGIENEKALQLKLAFDDEGYCTMAEPREQLINNVSDDAEAAAYISTLVPWNTKCMSQPLSHCAWKEIPIIYVHTT